MHTARYLLSAAIVIASLGSMSAAMAGEDTGLQVKPNASAEAPRIIPPPPPEVLTKGERIEPAINIIQRDWAEIQKFSIDGRVYAVKIIPRWGPPYWLYDANGDGTFKVHDNVLHRIPQTVEWTILTW